MRRTATALCALLLSASPLVLTAGVASAQEGDAQSPPTTIDVETSTVTEERTVTTLDVEEVDTDDDDDSDKTGLWGLLGLLGLAGLAGLKKRRDDDGHHAPTITSTAPPTASGASTGTSRTGGSYPTTGTGGSTGTGRNP